MKIFSPHEQEYQDISKVYNLFASLRPDYIYQPTSMADIISALSFARLNDYKVIVKGGGHGWCGLKTCLRYIVIDMSSLREVKVDACRKTMTLQAGAQNADQDRACVEYGLALPAGDCPMVGVAGLLSGGGNGFLSRKFGLSCDHLLSATIVTYDGEVLVINKDSYPDLFWAIKGSGGNNFGVFYSFTVKLNPIPKMMYGGKLIWPLSKSREVIYAYTQLMATCEDEFSVMGRVNREFFDEDKFYIYGLHCSDSERGQFLFNQLVKMQKPESVELGVSPYVHFQGINESSIQPHPTYCWKSRFVDAISEEMIDALLEIYLSSPVAGRRVNFDTLGGKINKVSQESSAFIHRTYSFILSIVAVWNLDSEEIVALNWARKSMEKLSPWLSKFAYVNYPDVDLIATPETYFGAAYDKLKVLKKRYDPEKIFMGLVD